MLETPTPIVRTPPVGLPVWRRRRELQAWLGDSPVLIAGAILLCTVVALPILSVLGNIFRSSNGTKIGRAHV